MNIAADLMRWFGLDDPGAPFYLFWSGFGSDLSELALLGGIFGVARHHNCHVKGCLRIKTYPVVGTPYKACKRHHPALPDVITAKHIKAAHEQLQ
jgi:hypothetical protein